MRQQIWVNLPGLMTQLMHRYALTVANSAVALYRLADIRRIQSTSVSFLVLTFTCKSHAPALSNMLLYYASANA